MLEKKREAGDGTPVYNVVMIYNVINYCYVAITSVKTCFVDIPQH